MTKVTTPATEYQAKRAGWKRSSKEWALDQSQWRNTTGILEPWCNYSVSYSYFIPRSTDTCRLKTQVQSTKSSQSYLVLGYWCGGKFSRAWHYFTMGSDLWANSIVCHVCVESSRRAWRQSSYTYSIQLVEQSTPIVKYGSVKRTKTSSEYQVWNRDAVSAYEESLHHKPRMPRDNSWPSRQPSLRTWY